MDLVDIRKVLLEQHADLRTTLAKARELATLWGSGDAKRDALRDCLQALANQVDKHNAYEEKVLRKVLPTVDAWGEARYEVMSEEHIAEHKNLGAGLLAAVTSNQPPDGAAAVLRLLDSMLDHMQREERFFLAADVLTDDIAAKDYFGG